MKKRLIQILKIVVPVALGVYLAAHIYGELDESQRRSVFESFREANYFWVAMSFVMGLLSHWIRGYRWKFQLEAMGYQSRTANNFMAVMIGYFVNMMLPRVGEVSRAASISKFEEIPFQKSFGSILSERALDMILLLIITTITIFLQYNLLESYADDFTGLLTNFIGSTKFWLLIAGGVLGLAFLAYAIKQRHKFPFMEKLLGFVFGLFEGLKSIVKMKKWPAYIISTILIWVLYVGMFWVCFLSIEDAAHLGAGAIFAGFVIGSFAIVLIPGGIGAFPVGIMQCLLLYGIAEETGFALGWIIWLAQTVMVLIFGGLSMLIMPIYNKKYPHVATQLSKG